jgi:integrase/recombinase XerD
MTVLRQKMIEDMQLRGFALRTQEAYLLAVRQLARYYNKSPDLVTEEELRQYFLYLKNVKHAARNTCTQCRSYAQQQTFSCTIILSNGLLSLLNIF